MRALTLALFATVPLLAQSALYIDLAGEWRRSADDQVAYAQPDFDDRAWAIARLPWKEMPCRRGATCTFWLRRSIDLPDWADKSRLAITLGPVSPIYEVHVNGTRISASGPFNATSARIARTRTHLIPARVVGSAGRVTVAIRARTTDFGVQALGVSNGGSYLLTYAEHAPVNEGRFLLDQQRARYASSLVLSVLLFAFAVLLGFLWLAGRGRTEPLWLGLLVALRAMFDWNYYSYLQADAGPYRIFALTLFGDVALVELSLASAGINARWLRVLVWALGLGHLFMGIEARWTSRAFDAAAIGIVLTGWRRNGGVRQTPVRHLITAALVLLAFARINSGGVGLLPVFIDFAGYLWSLQSLATALFAGMLTILLVLSLGGDRKEKQRLAGELEAARGVQQLLVAGGQPITKDYAVESVYDPAQEVGGDFYQVLPAGGGALLVVVGDVSGKGLKAAIVVSMMTGVVRAHVALPPAALLKEMNRVLGEGSGGFVTCLAIRCEPGGLLTMANAGHLAPYRDGVEVPVDSGLPLGVALDAEFSETSLRLEAGVLTIVTDGIVEAANAKGDLFGFDRTREISKRSAQEIADAAKAWGKNDDITVVTVRRLA